MDTTNANPALFAALSAAQGEIENAAKNAANPHFKSKYADLAEVLNTVRPVFARHGLSLTQSTEFDGSLVSVVSLVAHKDGGYLTATASCVPAKTDAQGIGSATTYLRRYSAAAVAGIAQEDDDGQAAAHNGRPLTEAFAASPTSGAWEAQSAESQAFLLKLAAEVVTRCKADPADAHDYIESQGLDPDEKVALWTRLESPIRTALKKVAANKTMEKAA
jgi:hypothetical protein